MQMSAERNKLFKEQNDLNRVDTALNIKGKKMQLYRDIRKGLSDERSSLRALKKEVGYDSDDSEAIETKKSIDQYKHASEDALSGLQEKQQVAEVQVPTRSSENNQSPDNPPRGDKDDSSYESESNQLAV
jgi:hypothetical protein